jgi:hypothetical protein
MVPSARMRATSTSWTAPPSLSPTASVAPSADSAATAVKNGTGTERSSTGSSVRPSTQTIRLPSGSYDAASTGAEKGADAGACGGAAASSSPPQPARATTVAATRRSRIAITSGTPPGRCGFQ